MRWNPETGQIVADLEWTRLETVLGLLPPVYSTLEEKLHLAGKARLTGGMIRDGAVVGATIEFKQMRAAMPVGDAGPAPSFKPVASPCNESAGRL